jgi:hypothetical protein
VELNYTSTLPCVLMKPNEAQGQLYTFAFYPCHRSVRRRRSELEGTCGYVEQAVAQYFSLEAGLLTICYNLLHVLLADLCEFGNEPSSFIKGSIYLPQSDYQLPKDSALILLVLCIKS